MPTARTCYGSAVLLIVLFLLPFSEALCRVPIVQFAASLWPGFCPYARNFSHGGSRLISSEGHSGQNRKVLAQGATVL